MLIVAMAPSLSVQLMLKMAINARYNAVLDLIDTMAIASPAVTALYAKNAALSMLACATNVLMAITTI